MSERRETLKDLAKEELRIAEWLAANKQSFFEAIGCYCPDEMMILALAKLPDQLGGRWRGFKDDFDRAACDSLTAFLRGQPVDLEELRLAVSNLVGRFNNCCEAMAQRQRQPRPTPFPRPPRFPRPLR